MTNEEVTVTAEVDVSNHYSQGQALQVVRMPMSMLGIRFKNSGTLPEELKGQYTSAANAVRDIHKFLNQRTAAAEFSKRRADAKKGLKRLQKEPEE